MLGKESTATQGKDGLASHPRGRKRPLRAIARLEYRL